MTSKRKRNDESTQDEEPELADSKGLQKKNKKKYISTEERHLTNDWYAMAEGLEASSNPLYRQVTAIELDYLVGWATHITTHHCAGGNTPLSGSHPFLDLPSRPLPPSMLNIIVEEATKAIFSKPDGRWRYLSRAFDPSALVSLGICLEEMITASLLPLAEAHVEICRKAEETGQGWDLWSLPPEKCILEISKLPWLNKPKATLPTLLPPTASAIAVHGGRERPFSLFNLPLESKEQVAMKNWAKAHGLSVPFVEENKDLFNAFQNA